jgi:F-type H+-transporting ATPase subunit a
MNLTPDSIVFFEYGFIKLNATIVFTWIVMAVLMVVALLATRNLSKGPKMSRWQGFLEMVVSRIREQLRNMTQRKPDQFLPFLGTLFLFISVANLLDLIPYYDPPTGSLSVTAALAICVFVAVPAYGIREKGFGGYMKSYIEPSPFMLPFNIIGEVSRTFSLAVRLFGNIMSGTMIVGVLVSIAPFFVPIVMQALGLLIGQIQAYIFAALATVYIASGMRRQQPNNQQSETHDASSKTREENQEES